MAQRSSRSSRGGWSFSALLGMGSACADKTWQGYGNGDRGELTFLFPAGFTCAGTSLDLLVARDEWRSTGKFRIDMNSGGGAEHRAAPFELESVHCEPTTLCSVRGAGPQNSAPVVWGTHISYQVVPPKPTERSRDCQKQAVVLQLDVGTPGRGKLVVRGRVNDKIVEDSTDFVVAPRPQQIELVNEPEPILLGTKRSADQTLKLALLHDGQPVFGRVDVRLDASTFSPHGLNVILVPDEDPPLTQPRNRLCKRRPDGSCRPYPVPYYDQIYRLRVIASEAGEATLVVKSGDGSRSVSIRAIR